MEKVLSLIIPTYNMEKYLNKCLDSLVVKNMDLLEILIINDGSKDCSSEIAHEYEKKYPNTFRVIDKENGNYGSCINKGLEIAIGKYIKILDADDYFESENLSEYISFLSKNDADLIISNFQIVNEQYKVMSNVTFNIPPIKELNFNDVYNYISILNLQMHAVTYRRTNILSLNYKQTEGISYTDQEWMFLPMCNIKKIIYYDRIIYKYLVGREGQTMNPQIVSKQISHTIQGIINMLETYNNITNMSPEARIYLDYRLCSRINYVYNHFLINESNNYSNVLETFDKQIKTKSSYFYKLSSNYCKIAKIQYVKYWRNRTFSILKLVRVLHKLQILRNRILN